MCVYVCVEEGGERGRVCMCVEESGERVCVCVWTRERGERERMREEQMCVNGREKMDVISK